MSIRALAVSFLALSSAHAQAGGIERAPQSIAPLFEEGRYLEFSFATVNPDVSGKQRTTLPFSVAGSKSGDMSPSYQQYGAAYKGDLNDRISYALIFDQPWGADVDYDSGTGYFAQGSDASFDSNAFTAILQYNFPSNVSVYGGVRYQVIKADAFVPFVTGAAGPFAFAPYEADADSDGAFGFMGGVAYERPDIALRVSLTYQSKVKHDLDTTESSVLGPDVDSSTSIDTPQSLTLDFQTGVAKDTLVFGSVRWVDWSSFEIAPQEYVALVGSPLVFFDDDRVKYTLGVGRRLTEKWSVAGALNYEAQTGSRTGNLGPTDGAIGGGLSAIYSPNDSLTVTAGVSYAKIGDATTRVGPGTGGVFRNNDAWGFGVRVGYSF